VSVVSIGGLVVAHVGRRLLLVRTPRQCAMPRHNGNFLGTFWEEKFQVSSLLVYYESIKREPKIRGIKKCRCDERLQTKQRNLWKK
jgi:hypothetical protein